MGLPGSGKTFIAKRISKILKAEWLNADKIRGKYNDWDFSHDGIIRQVNRMKILSLKSKKKYVVADFVSPLHEQIKIFRPDKIIWMDTIKKGRFHSMNKLFKPPKYYDLRIKDKNIEINLIKLHDKIIKYKWKEKNPSGNIILKNQSLLPIQRKKFEKQIKKFGQVSIFANYSKNSEENTFLFSKIKKKINKDLIDFKGRFRVFKFKEYKQ